MEGRINQRHHGRLEIELAGNLVCGIGHDRGSAVSWPVEWFPWMGKASILMGLKR